VIRSMTGFAAVSREADGDRVGVTVKSVNHRFLDVAIKAPAALASVESRIRAAVQQRLARGRVEVTVSVEVAPDESKEVVLNAALLERFAAALEDARARGHVSGHFTPTDLLRLPHVLEVRTAGPERALGPDGLAETVVVEALDALVVMRETEGGFLAADLDARTSRIGTLVEGLEGAARSGQAGLEARLRERVAGLPPDLVGDPAAVAQEIVRVVARSDIDEEIARLRGHLEHWRGLVTGPDPCGRKLDFLVQEMNREINTIGSKVEGLEAGGLVIDAKAELERVREQVQNVE